LGFNYLLFEFKQRGDAALRANNWFPDESYMVDWFAVKSSTEKEARETLIKQFGQVPSHLFITAHHQRVFRIAPNPDARLNSNTSKVLKDTIFELERQSQLMTKSYSQELQFTQDIFLYPSLKKLLNFRARSQCLRALQPPNSPQRKNS
jgi:hypothetical protein